MRKIQFTMAAKFLFLAVILVCGFLTTSANAASEGPGSAILFTYYDVRDIADGGLGTNDNYFTVINPTSAWEQAHVRIRTGDHSTELLDFDIMLSPNDVFSFDLSKDDAGVAFSSLDIGTLSATKELVPFIQDLGGGVMGVAFSTNPASPFYALAADGVTPLLTSLLVKCEGETIAKAALDSQKGYVEVIAEGLIMDCASTPWTKGNRPGNTLINPGTAHVSSPLDKLHGMCPKTSKGQLVDTAACSTANAANLVDITEHTLYELASNHTDPVDGLCEASIERVKPGLLGRVYFATVAPDKSTTMRLTHMNAEATDNALGALRPATGHRIILHANDYTAELAAPRCIATTFSSGYTDGDENCFAYSEPSTNGAGQLDDATQLGGANDMNFCFYQDVITDSTSTDFGLGVQNKFGAAATFGPTIADLYWKRNGSIDRTAHILTQLIGDASFGTLTFNFEPYPAFFKNIVMTHFFFSPAPADFDLQTAIAFIFPFQHFINEHDKLGAQAVYDMNENPCTTPTGGFISPGLPGPGLPTTEEAFLQFIRPTGTCKVAEGWTSFGPITATNDTQLANHCTAPHFPIADQMGTVPSTPCLTANDYQDPTKPYTPGWTGGIFVLGTDSLSSSLLNVFSTFETGD